MPSIEHRLVLHYYNIKKAEQNNVEFKQKENKISTLHQSQCNNGFQWRPVRCNSRKYTPQNYTPGMFLLRQHAMVVDLFMYTFEYH